MILFILLVCFTGEITGVVFKSPNALDRYEFQGNETFMGVMFRVKDNRTEAPDMPRVLSYCTCSAISKFWVLTSRRCYIHLGWPILLNVTHFSKEPPLKKKYFRVQRVVDLGEYCLIQFYRRIRTPTIELAPMPASTTACKMYTYSTPDKKFVNPTPEGRAFQVWEMAGPLYEIDVTVVPYQKCRQELGPRGFMPYKENIDDTTLCISAGGSQKFEPCTFDRGAPVICGDKLLGILIVNQLVGEDPNGCFGNFTKRIYYGEGMSRDLFDEVEILKVQIPPIEEKEERASRSPPLYSPDIKINFLFLSISYLVLWIFNPS